MERRKTPRTSIPKLAYVNFEPYNTGGLIADLSTAGLRFHTVAPVQQGGVVRLSLTLGALKQIETVGELVWTDSTRQIGGVRFVILPPATAGQIKNWLEHSASANAGENGAKSESEITGQLTETIAPVAAGSLAELEKLPAPGPSGIDENQQALRPEIPPVLPTVPSQNIPLPAPGGDSTVRPPWVPPSIRPAVAASPTEAQSSDASKGSTLPPYGWVLPGQPSTMPWITHFDPDPPERKSAFARGLIAAVIVCVLLAPVVWVGLHRYVWRNGSLSPVSSVASNPISAPPDATATNPAVPANDNLASSTDANSAAANPSAVANPSDAKSVTANPLQATSAVPAPKPSANSPAGAVTQPAQSAQASSAASIPPAKPEAAASASNEAQSSSEQSAAAGSPIAANSPRDIAPDSLALASQRAAKTAPAPEAANPGESQLILAWQYLEGQGGKPRDPTAASQLLWSAVEKGNLTAETTLANLYLRGEGVAKSCDQARVLLSAASDKGSAEAKRKLLELDQSGCH